MNFRPKKWPKRIPTWREIWEAASRGMPVWRLKYGRRPTPRHYQAQGGPLHGKRLLLVDGTTATLRIGSQRGKYRCGIVASRSIGESGIGTTKWIPQGES